MPLCLCAFLLSACTYNASPINLELQPHEIDDEVAARFHPGMSVDDVVTELESIGSAHRVDRIPSANEPVGNEVVVTAFVQNAGWVLTAGHSGLAWGRLRFDFENDALIRVAYADPDSVAEPQVFAPIALEPAP